MTKLHISRLLLAMLSVFILAGSSLFVYIFTEIDGEEIVEVKISENEPGVVKFEGLGLSPGERCEYSVKLNSSVIDTASVSFDFTEIGDSLMKDYVYVTVEADGEEIYRALLSDCLLGEKIIFDYKKLTEEFKIIYSMPESVGNEAQNTEAHFELLITPII